MAYLGLDHTGGGGLEPVPGCIGHKAEAHLGWNLNYKAIYEL